MCSHIACLLFKDPYPYEIYYFVGIIMLSWANQLHIRVSYFDTIENWQTSRLDNRFDWELTIWSLFKKGWYSSHAKKERRLNLSSQEETIDELNKLVSWLHHEIDGKNKTIHRLQPCKPRLFKTELSISVWRSLMKEFWRLLSWKALQNVSFRTSWKNLRIRKIYFMILRMKLKISLILIILDFRSILMGWIKWIPSLRLNLYYCIFLLISFMKKPLPSKKIMFSYLMNARSLMKGCDIFLLQIDETIKGL